MPIITLARLLTVLVLTLTWLLPGTTAAAADPTPVGRANMSVDVDPSSGPGTSIIEAPEWASTWEGVRASFFVYVTNTGDVPLRVTQITGDSPIGDPYPPVMCSAPILPGVRQACAYRYVSMPSGASPGTRQEFQIGVTAEAAGQPLRSEARFTLLVVDRLPHTSLNVSASPTAIAPQGPVAFTLRLNPPFRYTPSFDVTGIQSRLFGDLTDPANPRLVSTTCRDHDGSAYAGCAYVARVAGKPGTTVEDTITVSLSDGTGPPGGAVTTVSVRLLSPPTVSVTLVPTPSRTPPGGPVRYALTVTSRSAYPLTLQSLFTWRYGNLRDPSNPAIQANTCPTLPRTLPSGESTQTCSFTALADSPALTSYRVTAVASVREDTTALTSTAATSTTIDVTWRAEPASAWALETIWPALSLLGREVTPRSRTSMVFWIAPRCRSTIPKRLGDLLQAPSPTPQCAPHRRLLQEATTALLNEAEYGSDYPARSPSAIVTDTNEALRARLRDINALADGYAQWNGDPTRAAPPD
ncbi:MAG: hypothetical protein IPL37_03260 [Austwickia sp.]|nr:hypothetical protein [Austwickia sp.]